MKKDISWPESKKNLLINFEKFPNLIGDLLDSAYLAGFDATRETATTNIKLDEPIKVTTHGETKKGESWRHGYQKGYDEALATVNKILLDELHLAHTTKSGKTSRLTSAINRVHSIMGL